VSDPASRAGRTNRRHRQTQIRRRRAVVLLALILVVAALVITLSSGSTPPPTGRSTSSSASTSTSAVPTTAPAASGSSSASGPEGAGTHRGRTTASGPPSLEAGMEAWQLAAPLSREALVTVGNRLRILGGLSSSGSSLSGASWLDPASGTVTASGSLADVVHDGAGAQIGATSYVFGGGSPDTFATVQTLGSAAATEAGAVAGQLPQPRSDLATATIGGTALPPESYTQPGDYTYTREVAPALLAGESVRVDFQLDKSMPPSGADLRDLGVVVLLPK